MRLKTANICGYKPYYPKPHYPYENPIYPFSGRGVYLQSLSTYQKRVETGIDAQYFAQQTHLPKDDWQKLLLLCKQNDYEKPELNYISTTDGKTISCTSASYRYAKKKSVKKALDYIAATLEKALIEPPVHRELEEKAAVQKEAKKAARKAAKQETWEEKQARKQQEKEKRKALKKQAAIERDRERRKAKEEAKKKESRKGKNTMYREYSAEEIAAMNSAKRRRLEDLGILAKQR